MPQVDLAFRLTGNKVPVDHGYALYSALSRILPEIHGTKNLGVLPIRGTYSGDGELMLRALSKRDVSRPCQRGVKESEMPKGVEHTGKWTGRSGRLSEGI